MHPLSFIIKRVHHRLLAYARPFAKFFNITPARYDLLRCIKRGDGYYQAELPDILGVTRTTVSRMLIALERQGLIVRTHLVDERGRRHRRMNWVAVTTEGRRVMTAIDGSIVYAWFQTAFEHFFMNERNIRRCAAERAVKKLSTTLARFAHAFFDTAYIKFQEPKPYRTLNRIHWVNLNLARRFRPDDTYRLYQLCLREDWANDLVA